MRRLATLTAAAALVLAFGFSGTAYAVDEQYADEVESFVPSELGDRSVDDGDDGLDALGAPQTVTTLDATAWTSLGFDAAGDPAGGTLVLNFTDNVCLVRAGADLNVWESAANEHFDVKVRQIDSSALLTVGNFIGEPAIIDVNATGLAWFNQVSMTATDVAGNVNATGADIDAIECLFSFDLGTAHIQKTNLGASTIGIQSKGGDDALQFFFFKITLTNPNSVDLTDIVFEDVLPAEFDLDPDGEETADGTDCPTDGVCDGVMVSAELNGANCTATGAEHTNQGKSNKSFKLQPDIITITADPGDGDVLVGDDVCEITVWARTDQKSDKANKVNFTPTECPSNGVIILNEGVEVIDTMGTVETSDDVTLLVDDDSLFLVCATSLLAFLTSTTFDGDLDGLAGADAECQGLADGQNLGGTYIAWLSDSNTDAKDRFDPAFASLPYLRTDNGATIADDFADLTDGDIDNAILGTESGGFFGTPINPWTGTLADGTLFGASETCQDWTSNSSGDVGRAGRSVNINSAWTSQINRTCDSLRRLYCFQKTTF